MTMKRALGMMMLVLLACGSGSDTPTASPTKQDVKSFTERFVWGDESQPAGDWDADAAQCTKHADEDPSVRRGAHPLVKIGVFTQCMEKLGWVFDSESH